MSGEWRACGSVAPTHVLSRFSPAQGLVERRAEMWTPGLAAREGRERRMGRDGGDWNLSCGERGELPTRGDTQTQETHRNNLG